MPQSRRQNLSLPVANKADHCCKAKCHRSLPSNHPSTYTNGLCERHFFLIDLSSNGNGDDNVDNYVTNEWKEKQIQQTKKQYEPLRGDIRITREVFDGRQWHIFEDTIDHRTSTINTDSSPLLTTIKDNNEPLVQLFRLLSSYKTIMDELNVQKSN